jgi:hypothetical protein
MSIVSCKVDNYGAPSAALSGKVLDNENNTMIENGGANNGTVIQLYEGNSNQAITSSSFPDGHFVNAALFPGKYRLVALGAFKMIEDTLRINLSNNTNNVDIKVIPNVRLKATLLDIGGTSATVKVEYDKIARDQVLNELAVVWGTVDNPNMYAYINGDLKRENVTSQNLITGEMTFTITGLTAGTKYYIRAASLTNAPGNYYNYSTTIIKQ